MTMWLFSCSVSTTSFLPLMSTNSGSGSSGATAARPVTSTTIFVGAIDGPVGSDREDGQIAAGQLRDGAVVHFLVALVLDGDREELAVGALGQRVGLAAEIAGGDDRLVARSTTARWPDGFALDSRRDDADQRIVAGDDCRGGLAANVHGAGGLRHSWDR